MRAAQKLLAKHKGRRAAVFDLPAAGKSRRLEVGMISIFDYNTVEAVLLACAILVNLAGIMFDSSRFAGPNAALYMCGYLSDADRADRSVLSLMLCRDEYNAIAYATAALLILSIIYYFTCFALDIMVVCCPARANTLFSVLRGTRKQTAKKDSKGMSWLQREVAQALHPHSLICVPQPRIMRMAKVAIHAANPPSIWSLILTCLTARLWPPPQPNRSPKTFKPWQVCWTQTKSRASPACPHWPCGRRCRRHTPASPT